MSYTTEHLAKPRDDEEIFSDKDLAMINRPQLNTYMQDRFVDYKHLNITLHAHDIPQSYWSKTRIPPRSSLNTNNDKGWIICTPESVNYVNQCYALPDMVFVDLRTDMTDEDVIELASKFKDCAVHDLVCVFREQDNSVFRNIANSIMLRLQYRIEKTYHGWVDKMVLLHEDDLLHLFYYSLPKVGFRVNANYELANRTALDFFMMYGMAFMPRNTYFRYFMNYSSWEGRKDYTTFATEWLAKQNFI